MTHYHNRQKHNLPGYTQNFRHYPYADSIGYCRLDSMNHIPFRRVADFGYRAILLLFPQKMFKGIIITTTRIINSFFMSMFPPFTGILSNGTVTKERGTFPAFGGINPSI